MKLFCRLAGYAAASCGLLVAALAVVSLAGGSPLGGDLLELPALLREFREGHERQRELDRKGREVGRRLDEKVTTVEALVVGRLSLREAAKRFRALNAEDPAAAAAARVTYPSASDEEATCRQVLAWVRGWLGDAPPEVRDEVMARLEREAQDIK